MTPNLHESREVVKYIPKALDGFVAVSDKGCRDTEDAMNTDTAIDYAAIDNEIDALFAGIVRADVGAPTAPTAHPVPTTTAAKSGFAVSVDGVDFDTGLVADDVRQTVELAAIYAAIPNSSSDERDATEVTIEPPDDGVIGVWTVRVVSGHEAYDLEECWGVMVRRPVWSVDIDETIDVDVRLVTEVA